jgi:hypothetical protein
MKILARSVLFEVTKIGKKNSVRMRIKEKVPPKKV